MFREIRVTLSIICFLVLVSILPVFTVETFKVSEFVDGIQIWFEAEAFDERSPNENYKLGIDE